MNLILAQLEPVATGAKWQVGLWVYLVVFTLLGLAMFYLVRGSGKQYIIAGKSLPFFLVGTTLLAQSLDANATMGNAGAIVSPGGFWSGFVLAGGLALCLLVTGTWFAKPLNRMNLITLPDFFWRRYDGKMEILVSIAMSISFMILLAGNIAGGAWIMKTIFGWNYGTALTVISIIVFFYTIAGGLWSVVATDVAQSYPAIIGFIVAAIYLWTTNDAATLSAAIPEGYTGLEGLTDPEFGAWANWGGIIALGIGDVVALDFMERVFAAKDPDTARKACFYGAGMTVITGLAASFIGLAAFGLIEGMVDANGFAVEGFDPRNVMSIVAIDHLPFILGLLVMGGIVGAGLSTADGGLLGVSSVWGRNIFQRNILKTWKQDHTAEEKEILDRKLLGITRLSAIPVLLGSVLFAIIKPEPGTLLILAFDVVLAGVFVPLALGIFWKKANTPGAIAGFLAGSGLRILFFFWWPFDELLYGLDTMLSPILCILVMVPVSLRTQESHPPKHHVIDYVPTDEEVLSTEW